MVDWNTFTSYREDKQNVTSQLLKTFGDPSKEKIKRAKMICRVPNVKAKRFPNKHTAANKKIWSKIKYENFDCVHCSQY